MLRVLSDIVGALDGGDVAVLTQLDLSAAFDAVDHSTLLPYFESKVRYMRHRPRLVLVRTSMTEKNDGIDMA